MYDKKISYENSGMGPCYIFLISKCRNVNIIKTVLANHKTFWWRCYTTCAFAFHCLFYILRWGVERQNRPSHPLMKIYAHTPPPPGHQTLPKRRPLWKILPTIKSDTWLCPVTWGHLSPSVCGVLLILRSTPNDK